MGRAWRYRDYSRRSSRPISSPMAPSAFLKSYNLTSARAKSADDGRRWIGFSEDDGCVFAAGADIRRQSRSVCQRVEDNAFHLCDWGTGYVLAADATPLQQSLCCYCIPGMPSPPVIFVISDCASAFPCSLACFTAFKTISSRNSTSFGSTTSLSILSAMMSPVPFVVTFPFLPPVILSTF